MQADMSLPIALLPLQSRRLHVAPTALRFAAPKLHCESHRAQSADIFPAALPNLGLQTERRTSSTSHAFRSTAFRLHPQATTLPSRETISVRTPQTALSIAPATAATIAYKSRPSRIPSG